MRKKFFVMLACLFLVTGIAMAQGRVSGIVVSAADGEPLIGAAVMVQGNTGKFAITDNDGRFSLDVRPGTKLEVSFIGMRPTVVDAAVNMRIVLEIDNSLEEAVVTGMTTQDKRLFSGAATKVSADDAKINGMADISRSLEGRAAGVSVQNVTGTFGTAPKIRVRGATSIYGSSKPLWVVDGVIMEDVTEVSSDQLSSGDAETLISSAIAGLNSDDIESFQILKDGSATSIYGARAMAGVIVVTTKKGKQGQSHLSYTGEFTMRLKPSYRNFNIMNSQDQMSVYQELQQKGYLNYASTSTASNGGIYKKMYDLISTYNATTGQFGLANTPEARAAYLREAEYRNTDWFDGLFSNDIMQNHSVSISTGTEKAQTYASISAMYDPGWTKQSKVNRYTINLNTSYKLKKWLTANFIGNASFRKQRAPGTIGQELDPVSGEVKRDFDINPYSYALNTSRALDPDEFYTRNYADFNIYHELENNYMDLKVNDLRIQGSLEFKPWKQMTITALAAVKSASTSQEHFILDDSNQALAYKAMETSTIRKNNPFLYTDPDNVYALPISVLPDGGIYERRNNDMFGWDTRFSMAYNNIFNTDHIVNFYGGMETNLVDRRTTWFRGWGMQYSLGEIPNYAYQVFKKGVEENTQYYSLANTHTRSAAFFAIGTYSYKGKYTITGTYRYEGTNFLGKSRSARWMPTWNVSGAWNAHEEKFFKSLNPVLTHATLRVSYSLTGDRPSISNSYAIYSSYNPWRPFAGVKESGLKVRNLANEGLTYEKKHELNVGADLGFLDNRINLVVDAYRRNNYDLIGLTNTQGIGGEINKYGNIATMKSNGAEVSLQTTNIKTKDFTWTTNLIYSHTHNEVTKLEADSRVIDLVSGNGFALKGYPVRSLFSIPFKGLNNEGLPTFLDQDGNISVSGVYFQESDKDKLGFLKYEGSIEPTDVGSFGNVFRYKGLSLNVFITYSFGNVVRLDPVFSNTYDDLDSTPKEFNNRWIVPGDEKYTDVPVIASRRQNRNNTDLSIAYNSYNYSTARIARGDFIRMKEISMGYDFPKSVANKIGVGSLSLKLQGTNLFLLYADKKLNGQDPEFVNSGGVAVPVPKQFTFTLKIGL